MKGVWKWKKKKIEVTEKDFIKATARMCTTDKNTKELIEGMPMLMLLFPVISSKLWDELVKIKEENENGEAE